MFSLKVDPKLIAKLSTIHKVKLQLTPLRFSQKLPAPKTPVNAFAYPQSKRQRKTEAASSFHKRAATNLVDSLTEHIDSPAISELKIAEPETISVGKVGRATAKSQAHPKEKEELYTAVLQTWTLSDIYAMIESPLFPKLSSDHSNITEQEWKTLLEGIPDDLRKVAGLPEATTDYTVDSAATKQESDKYLTFIQQCKNAWLKNVSRIAPRTGQCTCEKLYKFFIRQFQVQFISLA